MEERTIISFDYAVKYLLRDKADFGILSGFLSELLNRNVVVDAILESESNKDDSDKKTNRVDLKARIDNGEFAVFEFQFHEAIDFFGKVLFGVSKAVVEQVSSGNDYEIKKVYSINVAYYNLGAQREYLFCGKFGGFRGVNFKEETISFAQASCTEGADVDLIADIHPEYYLILPNKFDEHLRNKFDEWVYVLKNSAVREDFTAAGIKEAKMKLDSLKMTPAERVTYEKYLNDKSSVDGALRFAINKGERRGLEKGRAEGRVEGLAEGRAEGKAEGIAEGIAKGQLEEKKKTALNMLKDGMSVDTVSKYTSLPKHQIEQLLNEQADIHIT